LKIVIIISFSAKEFVLKLKLRTELPRLALRFLLQGRFLENILTQISTMLLQLL